MNAEEIKAISESLRQDLISMAQRFIGSYGSADGAEDIVQESLVILWQLLKEDYPVRNVKALATKITRTRCIASYRKRRIIHQPLTDDNYPGGPPASSVMDEVDILIIKNRLYSQLSETQRLFLDLRNEEGMSLDEIVRLTGRPKSSIKSSISMARRQMLEQLKKEI